MKNKLIIFLTPFFLFSFSVHEASALFQPRKRELSTEGKLSIIPLFSFGVGLNDRKIGVAQNPQTGEEKALNLSAGGGLAGGLAIRYGISKFIDVEGGFTIQQSSERPKIENGSANFKRNVFFTSLLGKKAITKMANLYGGAGLGYYQSPKMSFNEFADVEVRYGNTVGYHAILGWMAKGLNGLSAGLETRYYSVEYSAESMIFGGLRAFEIPDGDGKSLRNIDGSGIDFRFFLSWQIN
ncbi:MAG: hypothetical protein ACE5FU_13085 [Nitrospinota bacterium]